MSGSQKTSGIDAVRSTHHILLTLDKMIVFRESDVGIGEKLKTQQTSPCTIFDVVDFRADVD
ncbi:MAG: hypothetical protein GY820_32415 [Gammaproteobacteria bacterium]|nr:hypothetical protein [Gammaproteobacteria bacterium]